MENGKLLTSKKYKINFTLTIPDISVGKWKLRLEAS